MDRHLPDIDFSRPASNAAVENGIARFADLVCAAVADLSAGHALNSCRAVRFRAMKSQSYVTPSPAPVGTGTQPSWPMQLS